MGGENEKSHLVEDSKAHQGKKFDYDPTFRGPIYDRSCTDVICLAIFVVCLTALAIIAAIGYHYGRPAILIHPTDSMGNLCGLGNQEPRKFLFFFDLTMCARYGISSLMRGCPTAQVCVEKCPNDDWLWKTFKSGNESDEALHLSKAICQYGVTPKDTADLEALVMHGKCAPYYFNSTPVADRCVPNIFKDAVDLTKAIFMDGQQLSNTLNETLTAADLKAASSALSTLMSAVNIGQKVMADLVANWWRMLLFVGVGALISFLFCLIIRFIAGILVYVTFTLLFFGSLIVAGVAFYQYKRLGDAPEQTTTVSAFDDPTFGRGGSLTRTQWLWVGIGCAVLALLTGIMFLCLRSRIRLAIAILGEASKAVGGNMCSLVFPLVPFLGQLLAIVFTISVAVYLKATVKAIQVNGNLPNGTSCAEHNVECRYTQYSSFDWANYTLAYTIFMGLWMLCFVVGMGQITLAGAFASWYWAWEKPRDVPMFPLTSAGIRALRFHTGSVAFGSLLIAIVMFIRLILEFLQDTLTGSQNKVAQFFFCILRCCFWCLEKVLRFITKNAFIMIAIHGKNFCASATEAFFLVMRNCVRLVVVDNVTGVLLFVGKLLVTAFIGVLSYFYFKGSLAGFLGQPSTPLNYFYVAVIVCVVATWFVASLFFDVYSFAVDTLFLCVMEDLERHDGTPEKPYFMSKELMHVLHKKNELPTSEGGAGHEAEQEHNGCIFCC